MSSRHRRRERRGGGRRWGAIAVGVGLVLILTVGWLAFGGVHHGSRAVLHAMLAAAIGGAALLPARSLRHAGKLVPIGAACALLLVPCFIELVPLPLGVREWVAPANVAARPGFAWWTLSIDPEATVGEVCDLLLPVGALILATAWGAVWWRRSEIERGLRVALVLVVAVGAIHALSGTTALFRLVQSSLQPPQRFFAPFIDPNHLASAIVLLLPSTLAVVWNDTAPRWVRVVWGAVAVAAGILLLAIGSSGGVIATVAVVILTAWHLGAVSGQRLVIAGVVGAVVAIPWFWVADPHSGVTMIDRVDTWRRALATVPGHWLAGSGGGTFEAAIRPTLHRFSGWAHAHNDAVEWIVEHGLVGVIVAVPIVLLLRPRQSVWSQRASIVAVGVAGVLVHALVDFPLQIPAIAMGAAAIWGLRRSAFEPRIDGNPTGIRAILGAVVLVEVLAAGWELRTLRVARAEEMVQAKGATAMGVERTLAMLAPWSAELAMLGAWDAENSGNREATLASARSLASHHPDDPRALRVAGVIFARAGATDEAMAAFDRSILQYPGDWRTWVALALAAPPERTIDAWKDAFRAGAPTKYLLPAWAAMPEGLVWLDVAGSREARFSANLGGFLQAQGDLETAALAYEQAYLIDPGEVPHPGYAEVLRKLGRTAEAERFVATSLALQPENERLLRQQAELLEAQGRYPDAADVWMHLAANDPATVVRAMRAIERANGPRDALRLAERLRLVGSLDPLVVLECARLRRDMGEFGECSVDLKRSGLLGDSVYGDRARALLKTCAIVR